MAKILKNITNSNIDIMDTGVTIVANSSYTIPPQDYLLWAASDNIVTKVGDSLIVVNDGSYDLGISDGIDLIKGLYPSYIFNQILLSMGGSQPSIFKQNQVSSPSRTETDLSSTSYTVPANKIFKITGFYASYDAQALLYVRLKKQTGGTGNFLTLFQLTMMAGGQGNPTACYPLGNGITIGSATDVFKITVEASVAKGIIWAGFGGEEI